MTTYLLAESENGIQFNGGARQLWQCKEPEVILSGPAECGKTIAALHKLDALMWKYPKAQAAIIRKIYSSIKSSVIPSFEKKVLSHHINDDKSPIRKYGGESVQFYEYPNDSRIWVFGMDKPAKLLSSELDFAYVNQAEDLLLDDWETLTTRVTGRAGNSPYAQIFGDCNPASSTHWILERTELGTLKLFNQIHKDNPFLYKNDEWTAQGKITMSRLDALTGARKKRLKDGLWVSAEGQIYQEFNPATHIIDAFDIPPEWRKIRAIDFGYTNPFVCLWIAISPDNDMYIYRQIYMSGRLVETHAEDILKYSSGEYIEATICDHDSEHRASLILKGIDNVKANKKVLLGIQKVEKRINGNNGKLFIFRNSLAELDRKLNEDKKSTKIEDEFGDYVWDSKKEQPIKANDHAMDALRYGVMYIDGGGVWVR